MTTEQNYPGRGNAGVHEREVAFVDEYLANGKNATQAYLVAYPSGNEENARKRGQEIMRRPTVQAMINTAMAESMERMEVNADTIVQHLAAIAFVDIADLVDDAGRMKSLTGMPLKVRKAIAGVTHSKYGVTLKLESRTKALELLARHLGMLTERHEVDASERLADLILKARDRNKPRNRIAGGLFS